MWSPHLRITMKRFRLTDDRLGYLMVAPLVLWLLGTMIFPVVWAFRTSLFDQRIIGSDAPFVGFDLYKKLIIHPDVLDALKKSITWTVGGSLLSLVLGVAVAILLFQEFKGREILRTWILVPWILPPVVMVVIWRWILSGSSGILNELLQELGLIALPIMFLESGGMAMITMIAVNSWRWIPFNAVSFLASMMTVDDELFDAAVIDGAGPIQKFIYVLWPHIRPVVLINSLLGGFLTFNAFALIWLFTQGGPGTTTTTLPILIYTKAFNTWRASEGAVISFLMGIVLVIVLVLYFRFASKEEFEADV